MANSLIFLAAESSSAEGGLNPVAVGAGAFVVLAILLLGVLAFGGGREHS